MIVIIFILSFFLSSNSSKRKKFFESYLTRSIGVRRIYSLSIVKSIYSLGLAWHTYFTFTLSWACQYFFYSNKHIDNLFSCRMLAKSFLIIPSSSPLSLTRLLARWYNSRRLAISFWQNIVWLLLL